MTNQSLMSNALSVKYQNVQSLSYVSLVINLIGPIK